MSSARQTLEMLENNNNANRKLVLNKFFRDVMIKLFNVVILEIVELYLMSLIVLCFALLIMKK